MTAFWFWYAVFPGRFFYFFLIFFSRKMESCQNIGIFRPSILATSFPGNNLRKIPVGNTTDANSISTKISLVKWWVFLPKLTQTIPNVNFASQAEVAVVRPFVNLSLYLCYCLNTDVIPLTTPIHSEYTWTNCVALAHLSLHTVTENSTYRNIWNIIFLEIFL